MRLILPILLLTATAALAQGQPAEKPYIYDAQPRMDLKSFKPPEAPRPLPENAIQGDRMQRTDLCTFKNPPPCKKPEVPKPLPKGVG